MTSWSVVAITGVITLTFAWLARRSSDSRRQQWTAGAGAWLGVTALTTLSALRVDSPILTWLAILVVAVCATIGVWFRWHQPVS
jgi:hypothetical protein